jgi:hypothetical protein
MRDGSNELLGEDLNNRWDKSGGKISTGTTSKDHFKTTSGHLICGLFHEAGNIQVATFAET